MPRTPEQNQNIKDKRRSKLLNHALKAFAMHGYDHTAIDDITKSAKCSHGLFYHYFDSKEKVFSALINEVLTGELRVPLDLALEQGSVRGIRTLCDYAANVARSGGKLGYVAKITFFLPDATSLDEDAQAFADAYNVEKALVTLIRRGQEDGKVIAGNPNQIARAFLYLVEGGILQSAKKGPWDIDADILYGMFLKTPITD